MIPLKPQTFRSYLINLYPLWHYFFPSLMKPGVSPTPGSTAANTALRKQRTAYSKMQSELTVVH